jgi:hypothetical protein
MRLGAAGCRAMWSTCIWETQGLRALGLRLYRSSRRPGRCGPRDRSSISEGFSRVCTFVGHTVTFRVDSQ